MNINDDWSCLQCGQCKYFSVKADREESFCKRIDHKNVKFAVPWFKSYDCGQSRGRVCRDFYPAKWCKWLYEHWVSFDDYYDGLEFKGLTYFTLGEDTSVRYGVEVTDFINGTMYDEDGKLKWVEKMYYKRVKKSDKHPTGYTLVRERREEDGAK